MSRPTTRQVETSLDVLMWLYEHSEDDDGRLREDIGYVRHKLYEVLA